MDVKEQKLYAALLTEIRDELEKEIRREQEGVEYPTAGDSMDVAEFHLNQAVRSELHNRYESLYHKVVGALERLRDGTYGQCVQCGREIAEKRLRVVPWADLCTACQEAADEKAA